MAEVIGLAASVTGLISFGLSVCKGLTEYYNSYKGAEKDIKFLCEDVNNLTQTLKVRLAGNSSLLYPGHLDRPISTLILPMP
jgi:hypothetical protein